MILSWFNIAKYLYKLIFLILLPKQRIFESVNWAEDHISIESICGIGGERGIDSDDLGSIFMIEEWGYPDIGIIICDCPSAGYDAVMLDYSICGKNGEPQVIHVDVEVGKITFLAQCL